MHRFAYIMIRLFGGLFLITGCTYAPATPSVDPTEGAQMLAGKYLMELTKRI